MLSASLRDSLTDLAEQFYQELNPDTAMYLSDRGLDQEVVDTFHLGYVGNEIPGWEWAVGRLAIPYLTPAGVVDIRFRATKGEEPKYLGRTGATPGMFNVNAFRVDSDVIGICEGEIDTITMHGLCGIPAVGIPGVSAWKNYYARAFVDYRRVILFCDGDKPGLEWGRKIVTQIDAALIVSMPEGQDVNSTYLSEGPDGVLRRAGL